MSNQSIIRNHDLAYSGNEKIAWAKDHMPILGEILQENSNKHPFRGDVIVTSIHMEAKTACLVKALAELGATVYATGCNPLSTQDDVAAALANTPGVTVYAVYNISAEEYNDYLRKALSHYPHFIIDDGGDLVHLLHANYSTYGKHLIGGCEETTTGILRLKALVAQKRLAFPMIDVNDADCKHLFDNHHGTGQSVMTEIMKTTNLEIAGKYFVVAGYGNCGSGIAKRARGLGAKVIVTEIDPVKALRAHMDGFRVMSMSEAAPIGDYFITATGCKDVITYSKFQHMKDDVILANAGHFNVEINLEQLGQMASSIDKRRNNIVGYRLPDGRRINVLAEGRLVNLASGDGHPAEIMDMSFSIQLLSLLYLKTHFDHSCISDVYSVPQSINRKVAFLALKANHINIDSLTLEQKNYLENGF